MTKIDNAVIGIDPGKSGCLYAIDIKTQNTLSFHDIKKIGTNIDINGIVKFLSQFNLETCFVITEDPHPHGAKDEVKSVYGGFEYGKSVGIIYGAVVGMFFKMHRVSPVAWKGYFALCSSKSTYLERKKLSVEKACYLHPTGADTFYTQHLTRRVLKHDRAESFLIALYFLQKLYHAD